MEKRLSSIENSIVADKSLLNITQNCNNLLVDQVKRLEIQILSNSQYAQNRQLEVHNVPESISSDDLSPRICEVLSLTGQLITHVVIDKCHRLKNKSSVIIEFKSRDMRDPVLYGRKELKSKKKKLRDMRMENIIITESLSYGYKRLNFICRMLKKNNLIHDTCFFNGRLFIKSHPTADRLAIVHINELYNLFQKYIIDGLLSK